MAYHHGDLATALVEAGLALTRTGGPDALSVRAVTRAAGVTPNAAYRHFPDRAALLSAVSLRIQQSMAARMADVDAGAGPLERLRAVGLGYIGFALAEPGWFAVTFFGEDAPDGGQLATTPPYLALTDTLDLLVHTGTIPAANRAAAGWACWSTVHGFAELALHGPLRGTPPDELARLSADAVDAIIRGVCAPAPSHRTD